jgi:hypothetical protein
MQLHDPSPQQNRPNIMNETISSRYLWNGCDRMRNNQVHDVALAPERPTVPSFPKIIEGILLRSCSVRHCGPHFHSMQNYVTIGRRIDGSVCSCSQCLSCVMSVQGANIKASMAERPWSRPRVNPVQRECDIRLLTRPRVCCDAERVRVLQQGAHFRFQPNFLIDHSA